eukprot:277825-Pyramimonas_sp.AAC.1
MLRVTDIDLHTSSRNYSYHSSRLRDAVGYLDLTRDVGGLHGWSSLESIRRHQARPPVEYKALNSVCCPNQVRETIPIVRVILRGAV